jgi:hypothetical protein
MTRRLVAGLGAIVTAAFVLTPAPAAATTYRYWSYWTGGDTWTYSPRGPGFRTPEDRGVEGWRFVVSPRDGSQAAAPGRPSSYDQLCPGAASAPEGSKRVAVVIDFGPAGVAPLGETPQATSVSCLVVPSGETGLQVLQRAARVRFHTSGLICGLAGFPARECPGQTAGTKTPPRPDPPDPVEQTAAPAPPAQQPPAPPVEAAAPTATEDGGEPTVAPTAATGTPQVRQSPVPVSLGTGAAQADTPAQPPAWVAAIGAALIAALLGLAVLARRGRA